MMFSKPHLAYLAILSPILIAFLRILAKRRASPMLHPRVSSIARRNPRRLRRRIVRISSFLLSTGVLALLLLAASGPYTYKKVQRNELAIVIALDASGSMIADDIKPTRLDAAKQLLADFVEKLPESSEISLISFSGDVILHVPLTRDKESILRALENLSVRWTGTAIGDAIVTATNILSSYNGTGYIVLFTDGSNNKGIDPIEAARRARALGIRIFCIGIGTEEGTYIRLPNGEVSLAVLDMETLAKISEETGGIAVQARTREDLKRVLDQIREEIVWRREKVDLTREFLVLAILLFLIDIVLGHVFPHWRIAI